MHNSMYTYWAFQLALHILVFKHFYHCLNLTLPEFCTLRMKCQNFFYYYTKIIIYLAHMHGMIFPQKSVLKLQCEFLQ